jgi:hypothetical protein
MEKHIKLVGILNIVYRSLAIFGALVLFALAIGFGYVMEIVSHFKHSQIQEIPEFVYTIVPIVLICIGIVILIVSVAGIIGAVGVLKRKEWGRITLIVVSFFNLLKFPLGTALGVYTLWALFNDEIIKLFNATPKKRK